MRQIPVTPLSLPCHGHGHRTTALVIITSVTASLTCSRMRLLDFFTWSKYDFVTRYKLRDRDVKLMGNSSNILHKWD